MAILALHPEEQEKLYQEVMEVCGDESPTYEHTKKFQYMSLFIKEVMRIYPPAALLRRELTQDDSFNGYHFNAGDSVFIDIHGIHHSPEIWEKPEEFIPERHLPSAIAEKNHYSWMGFGGGPRICIGNNFSLLEQKLFIALLLQKFKVKASPGQTKIELPVTPGLLKPINSKVVLTKR